MKCHTLDCMNDAQEGSSYCEECKPNKSRRKRDRCAKEGCTNERANATIFCKLSTSPPAACW